MDSQLDNQSENQDLVFENDKFILNTIDKNKISLSSKRKSSVFCTNTNNCQISRKKFKLSTRFVLKNKFTLNLNMNDVLKFEKIIPFVFSLDNPGNDRHSVEIDYNRTKIFSTLTNENKKKTYLCIQDLNSKLCENLFKKTSNQGDNFKNQILNEQDKNKTKTYLSSLKKQKFYKSKFEDSSDNHSSSNEIRNNVNSMEDSMNLLIIKKNHLKKDYSFFSLPIIFLNFNDIELNKMLKKPQLRHELLFNPGLNIKRFFYSEKSKKKNDLVDEFWSELKKECYEWLHNFSSENPKKLKLSNLISLFIYFRDFLKSLFPIKYFHQINKAMNIEQLIEQIDDDFSYFFEITKWLLNIFKAHCSSNNEHLVERMLELFQNLHDSNCVDSFVEGLKVILNILEEMKLDVIDCQIKFLKPILVETAIDFEKNYFDKLIKHNSFDISDTLKWFYNNYVKSFKTLNQSYIKGKFTKNKKISNFKTSLYLNEDGILNVLVFSIIDLLSCMKISVRFPSTLVFDHARIILLRFDVRLSICLQLCIYIFKILILKYKLSKSLLSSSNIQKLKKEILIIVTENKNAKWTKNIFSISLQLSKNAVADQLSQNLIHSVPQDMIDFVKNWLFKNIQPNSQVYGLMEKKIFNIFYQSIIKYCRVDNYDLIFCSFHLNAKENNFDINNFKDDFLQNSYLNNTFKEIQNELRSIILRLIKLIRIHWSVFGVYYINHIKSIKISSNYNN